ncbi:polysaccharide lyase [soil metagenome]
MRLRAAAFACLMMAGLAGPVWAADEAWRTVLHDGFEGRDFAKDGGLYYKDNLEQRAGKVEFQHKVVRTGKGALRLSVKAMCPPADESCSERAEIWERPKLRTPYDEGMWFGFAVKFEAPVPQDDHRYLIAQWKREISPGAEGDFSPFLALRMFRGKLFATVETNVLPAVSEDRSGGVASCKPGQTPAWLRPDTNQTRAIVATDASFAPRDGAMFQSCVDQITLTQRGAKLPDPKSGWIDFVIYTRPGPDGTGHIEIFANEKWVVSVIGHIGHGDKGLGSNQYFKFGPYRAGAPKPWALYYDDFRRGPRCADVMARALCPF